MQHIRKLLILLPDGKIHKVSLPFLTMSFREAPLTGTMLAALTPSDLGFDIKLCDASVSKIPYDEKFDLVAISIITGTAVEGYRLADHFRARGAKFGGWRYRSDFLTVEFEGRPRDLRGIPYIESGAL